MTSSEYSPELAAALDRLVPVDETLRADWEDVVGRAGKRARQRARLIRTRPLRLALAVVVVFLLLAGVATAAYYIGQAVTAWKQPAPNAVALDDDGKASDRLALPCCRGVRRVCQGRRLCAGRSPPRARDGLAERLEPLPGRAPCHRPRDRSRSPPPGGHLAPGDSGSPVGGLAAPWPGGDAPPRLRRTTRARLVTGRVPARVFVRRPHLHHPSRRHRAPSSCAPAQRAPTGLRGRRTEDGSPSRPSRAHGVRSTIYAVDLDGSHRQLVTRGGAAPDWSPDGTTIAYWAPACTGLRNEEGRTRLVTPDGRDVTPHARTRALRRDRSHLRASRLVAGRSPARGHELERPLRHGRGRQPRDRNWGNGQRHLRRRTTALAAAPMKGVPMTRLHVILVVARGDRRRHRDLVAGDAARHERPHRLRAPALPEHALG